MNPREREAQTAAPDGTGNPHHAAPAARWVADAVPEEVARLRAAVVAYANDLGAPSALVEDVRLAVSEALTNAVIHAYPRDAHGRLDARASADAAAGLLTIRVRDYGTGCRPRADSPGCGMGLPIMAAMTHAMEVASPAGGGTEVRLTFNLTPSPRRALA
jgi:anti-sigma regulatory factor (Ser/Thr protein kinase)